MLSLFAYSGRSNLLQKTSLILAISTILGLNACSFKHKHTIESGPRLHALFKSLKNGAIESREAIKGISEAIGEQLSFESNTTNSNAESLISNIINQNIEPDLEEFVVFESTNSENIYNLVFRNGENVPFNTETLTLRFLENDFQLVKDDSYGSYIDWWFISEESELIRVELMPDESDSSTIYGIFSVHLNNS